VPASILLKSHPRLFFLNLVVERRTRPEPPPQGSRKIHPMPPDRRPTTYTRTPPTQERSPAIGVSPWLPSG
jgi:hypothetical protein